MIIVGDENERPSGAKEKDVKMSKRWRERQGDKEL